MAFKNKISEKCVGCKALCGPSNDKRTCVEAIHSQDFQKVIKEKKIWNPIIYNDPDKKTGAAILTQLVSMPKEREIIAKIQKGVFYKRINLGPISFWF